MRGTSLLENVVSLERNAQGLIFAHRAAMASPLLRKGTLFLQLPPALTSAGANFHFIPCQTAESPTSKRIARSHAVSRGIENKRRKQRESGTQFQVCTAFKENSNALVNHRPRKNEIERPIHIYIGSSGMVHMLAAESPGLQALLNRGSYMQHCALDTDEIQENANFQSPNLTCPTSWFCRMS